MPFLHSQCIPCILNKYLDKVPAGTDESTRLAYARQVLTLVANMADKASAPEIVAEVTAVKNALFGYKDDFGALKAYYNDLMLSWEADFAAAIAEADDSLAMAVRFAMLGNYIDFGAMDSVDEERLRRIPADAAAIQLPTEEYGRFCEELAAAERLVYLTDNCGEVVMDKLLLAEIRRRFPSLAVQVLVRGEAVLNDATEADARRVGLDAVAPVTGNGTGIAGTCLHLLPTDKRQLVEQADVIIAKGQGNLETLMGCGLNVYYLFLCKCGMFATRFGVPRYTGMFINDRRMAT